MGYPYYPQNFNPYNPYAQLPQTSVPVQQQNQSTSFIHVQSEEQAREWSVAPNSSMTFIDDNAPFCYTKTMGGSMLEPPVFKRFRLVEEPLEPKRPQQQHMASSNIEYMTKSDFEPYKAIIDEMQKIVKELNGSGESS